MSEPFHWNCHRNDLDDWCPHTFAEASPEASTCPAGCPESQQITWTQLTENDRRYA